MTRQSVLAAALLGLSALVRPLPASAQGASARQAQPPSEPSPAPVTAGWRDGFIVQSENGDFRLQLALLVQADGRFAFDDERETVNDTFLMRRLRPSFRGQLTRRFEFALNPDFAGGTLVVQDAYLDTVFAPAVRVRLGKFKSPFGMERLQSASNLMFYDRALPSTIAPNRDIGVLVLGDIAGGRLGYMGGVTNGVADGASADADSSDGKDVAGRLVVRPFRATAESPLRGLSAGIALSAGRQAGSNALPTLRTASLQQPYFFYAGATADGTRTRYSPQVSYYYKSFGGIAEYVRSELPVRRGGLRDEIAHDAWQIAGSILFTGEGATDGTLRPRANFDFGQGHWGAVQIGARYHTLKVDERAFALGLTGDGASRKAESWTVGLNWYLTQYFKYVINFERTVFDDDADGARPAENALVFRGQLNF